MPRIRADDYADKKNKILDVAAALFAERGYTGCKMEDIAECCSVSKSMLYHYFKKKEDVLFEILQNHVSTLNDTIEDYANTADSTKKAEFFRGFVEIYLEKSSVARARHVVALHDMRYLTDEQKVSQEKLERKLVELVVDVLGKVNFGLKVGDYKIYSLLLIGMMNWIELWYRRNGRVSPNELYNRLSGLFLSGFFDVPGTETSGVTRSVADSGWSASKGRKTKVAAQARADR